ncbi:hypothetical protein CRUP_002293 [Coryphaenoides rupestris]|nr:hypothetical protein CRUP_002293 [Coryphaenoides rupestris]
MSSNERSDRELREILHKPGNDTPGVGVLLPGVFICLDCSGVHRNIPDIGKVKSLSLSRWEDHEVEFMAERGNERMRGKYEAAVPMYYYKPSHRDCQVLREQWIRAKYQRREFCDPGNKLTYEEETRDGMLMKRGRDNGQFLSRRFVLSEREGTLKYFTKTDLMPKLTRGFLKEGYMEKTGPKHTEGFKKRWFTLDHRRLMYFKDPLDAFAKGEVFLGNKEHGYSATAGLPATAHRNGAWQHGITIETPERSFLFTCETESDQQDWLQHFAAVLNATMSPQEYTMEALFKHRH